MLGARLAGGSGMVALKLLHIGAVIVWCGALLYLPLALTDHATAPRRVPRLLFNGLATPAALLAIGSGSALFVFHGPLAAWLIVKLMLVALLVLGHGACGMLLLRAERRIDAGQTTTGCRTCGVLLATSLLWLAGIAWLVLRKPF